MQEQQQDMKNVFCMEGGQGESSYINNSQSQSRNLKMIQLPHRQPGNKPLLTVVADLGCSCGHTTLLIADVIVDHMTKLCGTSRGSKDDDDADPEFYFYFSDLPSNDFNTLFHLLPQQAAAAGSGRRRRSRRYFPATVPCSFHA